MRVAIAALTASLLLSVLMLAAPVSDASAQQVVDEVCVTGTYVAGACQVRSDVVPECEPGSCVIDVQRPSVPRTETPERGPSRCPDGARGNGDGDCFIYVGLTPTGCPKGSFAGVEGHCLQPVANRAPSYECGQGSRLETILRTPTCVFDDDPIVGFCPSGAEPFNGRCADFVIDGLTANCGLRNEDLVSLQCLEPAELNPASAAVCSSATRFVEQACVRSADGLIADYCEYSGVRVNVLTGDRCRVVVEPLIARCPAGYSRDASFYITRTSNVCVRFAPAENSAAGELRCEAGQPTADGLSCFVPATVSVSTVCAEGIINDSRGACFATEAVQPGPLACPRGALGAVGDCYYTLPPVPTCSQGAVFGSLCLIPTGVSAVPGELVCPVSSTVFFDGDFCYALVYPLVSEEGVVQGCPSISIEQDGQCRREIELQPGPLTCEDPSHFLLDGQCLAAVPADSPSGSCPNGATFVGDVSECHQSVEASPSFIACANENAEQQGTLCVFRIGSPTASVCAAGFVVNRDGTACARYEPSIPGQAGCPAGSEAVSGDCFVDVTPLACSEGQQTDKVCLVYAAFAVQGPAVCEFMVDGDFCFRVVDRDSLGNCPTSTIEQDGECRVPAGIRPGPRACVDPAHVLLNNQCYSVSPADVATGPCPAGSVTNEATGRCLQMVTSVSTQACATPSAVLVDVTRCAIPSDFVTAPTQVDYGCPVGERVVTGAEISDVICIVGTPTAEQGRVCADGVLSVLNGRSCIWTEPFSAVVCPSGYVPIEAGKLCQGVLAAKTTYRCATYGDIVTTGVNGSTECAREFGPQPGECSGVTRDGQCYSFVDHTLACAPAGCLVSVPAIAAAPAAVRGDVDCNGQITVRDGLLLARTLVDDTIERRELCAGANPVDNLRINAADLAQDGTIDSDDARRLLQCLVDDNLASCAG